MQQPSLAASPHTLVASLCSLNLLRSSMHLNGFVATFMITLKVVAVCQFCRISATITDAVRSCPQTLHFYLERLAMPRLFSTYCSTKLLEIPFD